VGAVTNEEIRALRHAAEGQVLFHNGLWGAPAGYRWSAPDGSSAGRVPQWESEVLDLLVRRGLIAVDPVTGARDGVLAATGAGLAALSAAADLPIAA
jgi:hypothetical protein